MKLTDVYVFGSCGLLLFIATTGIGCAAMIRGTTENVTFSSVPSGALVTADGKQIGVTPTSAPLSRYDAHSIRIEKPGYIPFEVRTESIPDNKWWLLDCFFFPSALVDHGLYKIDPPSISANLISQSSTASASTTAAPLSSGNGTPANPPKASSSSP